MICPKCGIADINEDTGGCVLCGYELQGAVQIASATDDVRDAIQAHIGDALRLEDVAGVGRRSIVYRARDPEDGKLVAVKAMPIRERMDPEIVQRFRQDARTAETLDHSHIVPILDFGTSRALLWYTMEYIDGPSLALLLRDAPALALPDCLRIVEQVASALDYMHRRGVMHGNLKPTNVLMDQGKWARVSDAGVLKVTGRGRRGPRGLSLTLPEYIAPEQFELRTAGPAADQYALACLTYECLTGSPPFVGDSTEEVEEKHRLESPPDVAESIDAIPPVVSDAIGRALSKSPSARFSSVLDFVAMMRESSSAGAPQFFVTLPAPSTAPASSAAKQVVLIDGDRRRWPRVAGIVGAIAIAAALIVAVVFSVLNRSAAEPEFVTVELDEPFLREEAPTLDSAALVTPPPDSVTVGLPVEESVAPSVVERIPRRAPQRPPPAPLPGRLFISSVPWGQLFIDGESVGNTPKANLEIEAGVHTLRIQRDAFVVYEVEIAVEPGQEIRLLNIRLEPRS